jgi:drug/metabolite transporter (DMT)-like permease
LPTAPLRRLSLRNPLQKAIIRHLSLSFLPSMTNQPVRRPVDFFAFAVCVGLCFVWGLQQVAIKAAGDAVSPMLQVGLRSAVSGLLLWLFNRYWLKEVWNPEVKLRDALLVGLCFTGEFFFVSEGLRFTSAAHMSVLLYTAPLFSAVGLAVKLPEERLNLIQWAGLLLAFCGILVAFLLPALTEATPEENLWILGDALGLGAGISWGFATIFLRTTTMNGAPASQMLFWQLATGAVVLTAIALLTGQNHFESTTLDESSLSDLHREFCELPRLELASSPLLGFAPRRLSLHDADLRRGPERSPSRRNRGASLCGRFVARSRWTSFSASLAQTPSRIRRQKYCASIDGERVLPRKGIQIK